MPFPTVPKKSKTETKDLMPLKTKWCLTFLLNLLQSKTKSVYEMCVLL